VLYELDDEEGDMDGLFFSFEMLEVCNPEDYPKGEPKNPVNNLEDAEKISQEINPDIPLHKRPLFTKCSHCKCDYKSRIFSKCPNCTDLSEATNYGLYECSGCRSTFVLRRENEPVFCVDCENQKSLVRLRGIKEIYTIKAEEEEDDLAGVDKHFDDREKNQCPLASDPRGCTMWAPFEPSVPKELIGHCEAESKFSAQILSNFTHCPCPGSQEVPGLNKFEKAWRLYIKGKLEHPQGIGDEELFTDSLKKAGLNEQT